MVTEPLGGGIVVRCGPIAGVSLASETVLRTAWRMQCIEARLSLKSANVDEVDERRPDTGLPCPPMVRYLVLAGSPAAGGARAQ